VYARLLLGIAGSISPPVTTEHGDAAVFNFLCPAKHVNRPP
jgi:hypothetical protein